MCVSIQTWRKNHVNELCIYVYTHVYSCKYTHTCVYLYRRGEEIMSMGCPYFQASSLAFRREIEEWVHKGLVVPFDMNVRNTRAHTRKHVHTHKRTHVHIQNHARTQTHTHTHTPTRDHTHTPTYTLALSLSLSHTHVHTHTQIGTHTHKLSHSHTHKLTCKHARTH